MTPAEFKQITRKRVKSIYDAQSVDVIWTNENPEEELDAGQPPIPNSQGSHILCYFQGVDGGDAAFGGQVRCERFENILFLSARTPLGSGDHDATELAWLGLRGVVDARNPMAGVRIGQNRYTREDGEIRSMYQVTAIISLSFDFKG